MPTMNFSVPEDVKRAFNTTFKGQNKSAVLTQLMRVAIAQEQEQRLREAAANRILRRLGTAPVRSGRQLSAAREAGRP